MMCSTYNIYEYYTSSFAEIYLKNINKTVKYNWKCSEHFQIYTEKSFFSKFQ